MLKEKFLKRTLHIIYYKYLNYKKITNASENFINYTTPKSGVNLFGYHLFEILFIENDEAEAIKKLNSLKKKFINTKLNKDNRLAFYFYAKHLSYLNFINEKKYFRYPPKKGSALFAYLIFQNLIIADDKEAEKELKKQRAEFAKFLQNLKLTKLNFEIDKFIKILYSYKNI